MLARGNQVRGVGCYAQPVIRKWRGTSVSNGTSFTTDAAESDVGFSLGAVTSGRATLTFPKCKRACFLSGYVYNDTTVEAAMDLITLVSVPNAAAGTCVVQFETLAATSTEGTTTTGDIVEIFMILDEGSS